MRSRTSKNTKKKAIRISCPAAAEKLNASVVYSVLFNEGIRIVMHVHIHTLNILSSSIMISTACNLKGLKHT